MNKKKSFKFKEDYGFCFDLIKQCKIKTVILAIILLISILTGIVVACKTHSCYAVNKNYGVVDVTSGGLTTTFFARLFSMLLIAGICFGCSFLSYLFPN